MAADTLFPDVIAAEANRQSDGSWTISVTMSSPYDSAARYADAWRILGPGADVFGIRELAHDHAAEQPFTRSLGGVRLDDDVTQVIVEGRDQINGWGGSSFVLVLEGATQK